MPDNQTLREAFLRSDASPDGKWWVDFPVGVSIGPEGDHATVDALCLRSREPELPEAYPDHTGTSYVAPGADADVGITRADRVRTLRNGDTFADERAVLVAVESGASSVDTVGTLLAARELVRADWDWSVEELVLVSDEDSDHVTHICRELSVRAVRVT